MEYVAIDEMADMGYENVMDCWSTDVLISLYGDVPLDRLEDCPLDYTDAIQEELATLTPN